jgi:hypothetical protein
MLSPVFDLLEICCSYVIVIAIIRLLFFIYTVIKSLNALHVKFEWYNVTIFDRGLVSYDALVANAKHGLLAKAKSLIKLEDKAVVKIVNKANFKNHNRIGQKNLCQILFQSIVSDGRYEADILNIYLSDIISITYDDILNIESLYRDTYPSFDLLQFPPGTRDFSDEIMFSSSSIKSGDKIIFRFSYFVCTCYYFIYNVLL